ncbi:MAG: universal stress protein [Myxococcota bacterium]
MERLCKVRDWALHALHRAVYSGDMAADVQKILVPVDFSEGSGGALSYALALAEKLGAQVTVLHVVDYPPPYSQVEALTMVAPADGEVSFDRYLQNRAREDMKEFLAPFRNRGKFDEVFGSGGAADGIGEAAKSTAADLVVMGTHGRSGLKRLMLGSVAERTLRTCPCPVLIVPSSFED